MGNAHSGREVAKARKDGLIVTLDEDIPESASEAARVAAAAAAAVALNSPEVIAKKEGNLAAAVQADYRPTEQSEPVDLPFSLGKTLGTGAFGQVKLGTDIKTGDRIAIKIIPKAKLTAPGAAGNMEREIRMMKLLRNEHIVRLYDVVVARTKVYLAMEYADGGDMLAFVNSRKQLTEPVAAALFAQVMDGVLFCHRLGVCHRDLKLENLLLCGSVVKIADFGLANYAPPPTMAQSAFMETHCGSPLYAAPELLRNSAAYDATKVDIWSLGVVLYALACRKLPFEGDALPAILKKIVAADYVMPANLSPELTDLLRKMLTVDPAGRPTAEDVVAHPWLRDYMAAAEGELPAAIGCSITHNQLSVAEPMGSFDHDAKAGAPAADERRRPMTMSGADIRKEIAAAKAEAKAEARQ
jgi:serine/threonine protein kinase